MPYGLPRSTHDREGETSGFSNRSRTDRIGVMKQLLYETLHLDKIVGGGQTLGTLADGRKAFVWGGLPGEDVTIRLTKKKSSYVEGITTDVLQPSDERIEPLDPTSYLSTSPWQIMTFAAEQRYKAALITEAFALHHLTLPHEIDVYSDNHITQYRNKMEFSWYGATDPDSGLDTLDLAFFVRGGIGKVRVTTSALARPEIVELAQRLRDLLQAKEVSARSLKTLLIRCDQSGHCVWQLYCKERRADLISSDEAHSLAAQGGELIYSDPKSPASVITKRLASFGDPVLSDSIRGTSFRYATEGFFQVNIPVYEQALEDMQPWVTDAPVVDLYSGVGSIGLTIGGDSATLVEVNEHAVREMRENIARLHMAALPVLAPSEKALQYITEQATIIVDPPRAGLHHDVITRLLEVTPRRIIYLSCNPVTQARDTALLQESYLIRTHRGYNFFPRTPHIEHLVVLDKRP